MRRLNKDGEKMVSEDVRVNTRSIFGEDIAKLADSKYERRSAGVGLFEVF